MNKNDSIIFILSIIFICYILFVSVIGKREEFVLMDKGIGEYQYLAPIPAYEKWSDTIVDQFLVKYDQVADHEFPKEYIVNFLSTYTSEEEAKYYISNGKFPICPYVINYCNNEPTLINKFGLDSSGNPITIEMLRKGQPNRIIYAVIILPIQEKLDPKPDACLIYLGEKEPPTYNNDDSIVNKIVSYFS
jgi:hypothetical protein